jgi:hypothetical protein
LLRSDFIYDFILFIYYCLQREGVLLVSYSRSYLHRPTHPHELNRGGGGGLFEASARDATDGLWVAQVDLRRQVSFIYSVYWIDVIFQSVTGDDDDDDDKKSVWQTWAVGVLSDSRDGETYNGRHPSFEGLSNPLNRLVVVDQSILTSAFKNHNHNHNEYDCDDDDDNDDDRHA